MPEIEIVHLPVGKIDANDWNPNQVPDHVMQAAKESIERYGMIDPIVVRKTGARWQIIDGEHRYRVCADGGRETVPSIVVKASDAEAKKLTILLNDIKGRHDPDLLGALLADIKIELDIDEFMLALPYTEAELTGLLDRGVPLPGVNKDDDVPGVPLDPDSKAGMVYELGPHRLVCGDATDPAVVELLMQGERAKLLMTSPPYGDAREYDPASGRDLRPETLAQFIPAFAAHVDLMVVNLGVLRADDEVVTYWDDYTMAARMAGLKLLSWNVWDRLEAGTMGQQTAMFPTHHEWLFVYGRKSFKTNLTVPNKGAGDPAGLTVRQQSGSVEPTTGPAVIRERGHLASVLRNPPHKGRHEGIDHPAIYPVAVPDAYIRSTTQTGDTIVDPFAGSGSTMIAAENLGRACFMVEISPGYCDVIRRRWEEHTAK